MSNTATTQELAAMVAAWVGGEQVGAELADVLEEAGQAEAAGRVRGAAFVRRSIPCRRTYPPALQGAADPDPQLIILDVPKASREMIDPEDGSQTEYATELWPGSGTLNGKPFSVAQLLVVLARAHRDAGPEKLVWFMSKGGICAASIDHADGLQDQGAVTLSNQQPGDGEEW